MTGSSANGARRTSASTNTMGMRFSGSRWRRRSGFSIGDPCQKTHVTAVDRLWLIGVLCVVPVMGRTLRIISRRPPGTPTTVNW